MGRLAGYIYRQMYSHPDGEHVSKTGKRYKVSNLYHIKYRVGGRIIREATGTSDAKEARRILAKRVGQAADGKPINPRKVRVEELAEDLRKDYEANERPSLDRLDYSLKHVLPCFGRRRAQDVSSADVTAYITRRQADGAKNGTINRELGALKRMYSLAMAAEKIHRKPHIPHLREDNVRRGFFEEEQYRAILRHLPEYVRPIITFAYITGWRTKSEILPLQWRNVDFRAGTVRLDPGTTKTGEGRTFIMTPELRAMLEEQTKRTEALQKKQGRIIPWLFHRDGEPIKGFRRSWKTACRKAGVPGRIPHDFRRTAVRNLERAGVPRSTAMAMVGHKTESIYRRYAIVDEAMMREGAEKLAAFQAKGK